ncbi:MAG TPA: threonine synthase [Bacillota bacterium]|nr:threonine synthase [Bacillota bacterium]
MLYKSTRDSGDAKFTSAEVIKRGIADDGGLYVPENIPALGRDEIEKLRRMPYSERAAFILSKFLDDYSYDELLADSTAAYRAESFPGGPAPLARLDDRLFSLELWHGPTAAFKDMALQLMPRLLTRALKKTGEYRTVHILVATSGDTGKAALEGFKDIEQTRITVFYPESGVSLVQKRQMATQTGENVIVCAVRGNFDDCQNGVKRLFSDTELAAELDRRGFFLSSANSINWGRLVPQIVYYVSAYCDLLNIGALGAGDEFCVCVPTGNFGNILAGYFAGLMGIPIKKLICASNLNNALTDFLRRGIYDRNRTFHKTISPSMDILISSNLERLLYYVAGAEKTRKYTAELGKTGCYQISGEEKDKISEQFIGYYADETETAATIRGIFETYGYLCDTHTAVAFSCAEKYRQETGDNGIITVVSTASPYKFAGDVYRALTGKDPAGEFEALDQLYGYTGAPVPYPLAGIGSRPVRFTASVDKEKMKQYILGM